MAKKDARCFFDQLKLEECLHPYMGRPSFCVSDIVGVNGMTEAELATYLPLDCVLPADGRLVPVNKTWAMGFSWSSFIGQSLMVGTCKAAGADDLQFLCDENAVPPPAEYLLSVCTDDVLHFSRDGSAKGRAFMERLDSVWNTARLQQHEGKAIYDSVLDGTAMGIDLTGGTQIGPAAPKLLALLGAVIDLVGHRLASPCEVSSMLGVLQWFDLLNRWMLSCLHSVYGFCREGSSDRVRDVPDIVLDEILLNMVLFPFWETDLCREWLEKLLATDASPAFGFGVSVARCHHDLVRDIAGEPLDGHIRLQRSRGDAPEVYRKGPCRRLPLRKRAFQHVLSIRAKYYAHSGALEADALTLGLNWLSRTAGNHAKRIVILLDAKALLGACRKGRSSAPTLRRSLRRSAAVSIACDWRTHFHYIPSESMPADVPSRGIRTRPAIRRRVLKLKRGRKLTRLERRIQNLEAAYTHLRSCGMLLSSSSGTSSEGDWE